MHPSDEGADLRGTLESQHLVACIVECYISHMTMPAEKTVAISFRVSPRFKQLLEAAAAREGRSKTNMLETLLFDYCEQRGIAVSEQQDTEPSGASKGGANK